MGNQGVTGFFILCASCFGPTRKSAQCSRKRGCLCARLLTYPKCLEQGLLHGRPLVNSGRREGGSAGQRKEGGRQELMKEQQEGRGVPVKVAEPVKTRSGLPLALETSDDIPRSPRGFPQALLVWPLPQLAVRPWPSHSPSSPYLSWQSQLKGHFLRQVLQVPIVHTQK